MINAPYLLLLATLLPLASFLILIFFGRRFQAASGVVATLAILSSFGLSVYALILFLGNQSATHPVEGAVEAMTWNWIVLSKTATFQVGLLVDSLTLTMFVMITAVATLVHIFSIGYLKGDSRFSRFFAYLGLFCFSMLLLVVSNSLLQLFVAWELVGVCSYLLIGFWFEKSGPALASKKAMVTNRIGDAGFLIGLGILLMQLGPMSLTLFNDSGQPVLAAAVQEKARPALAVATTPALPAASEPQSTDSAAATAAATTTSHEAPAESTAAYLVNPAGDAFLGLSWLTWAGLGLCLGAIAKSAQFPLHVWLPDAMEGPTPVSALIHAATMVAAGVYLVARIFPILTLDARLFMAIIGCTTLFMASLIAMVMTDIKKILAYSTISQLGFMMLFLGCGGYVAGLFHLITHAFFKACLFLGSGSVIAACHHEQEITRMGGLWKKIPLTALTFLVSVMAISGVPFFSGYYSKDLGLAGAFEFGSALPRPYGMLLFWIPTCTAYLTAFYMTRCWWLTFGGKPRDQEIYDHAKEHPIMTFPLIVLGILAVIGGYKVLSVQELIQQSAPRDVLALLPSEESHGVHAVHQYVTWACVLGPLLALLIYFNGFTIADRLRRLPGVSLIYTWLKNKMYFDHLYEGVIVGLCKLVAILSATFDRFGVDGLVNFAGYFTRFVSWFSGLVDSNLVDLAVNGLALAAQSGGRAVMTPQTGRIRFYVLSLFTLVAITLAGLAIVVFTMG